VKTVHLLPILISALLYLLCIDANAAPPPSRLQVYETYAPAKIVHNYLSPLLKSGETLSVFRGKIIVNASAHTHSNILEMLNRVDHRAQKFLIHYRPIKTANKLHNAEQPPSVVRFSGSSTNGKITIRKRNHHIDEKVTYKEEQITLLEGKTGYLRGTTEKYKNTPVFANGFFANQPTLEKNGSGHYISISVIGGMATLQFSKKSPKTIRSSTSSQATQPGTKELTTPLSTWVPIPSVNGKPSSQEIHIQRAP